MCRHLWLVVLVALGCDSRSTPSTVERYDAGHPASCACAGVAQLTLEGRTVWLEEGWFGANITWGTHANPEPMTIYGVTLLLGEKGETCRADGALAPNEDGLATLAVDVRRLEHGWQRVGYTTAYWRGQRADVEGDACLLTLPAAKGESVGYPAENLREPVDGCIDLRLLRDDVAVGRVVGSFSALHCPALDSAMGE